MLGPPMVAWQPLSDYENPTAAVAAAGGRGRVVAVAAAALPLLRSGGGCGGAAAAAAAFLATSPSSWHCHRRRHGVGFDPGGSYYVLLLLPCLARTRGDEAKDKDSPFYFMQRMVHHLSRILKVAGGSVT